MERAETGAELCCNSGPFACASVSETEAEDNAKEEHHDEVLAEFYEGDFFGGWVTSVGPSLYRAHKERNLP